MNKNIKSAYFAFDIFSPSNTAGYVHTSEIVKNLSSLCQIKLFVAPTGDKIINPFIWNNEFDELKIDYARFTIWPKAYFLPVFPINALSYYSVYSKTKKFQPDIIHERFHCPNPFGWRIAKSLHIPRILEVNSPYIEDEAYKNWYAKLAIKDRLTQFTHADAIITQTETLKSILSRVTDIPIHVIPNGVNTSKFKPTPSTLKSTLGIPPDSPVVCFSGSFKSWHGTNLIPQIITQTQQSHPNTFFLILCPNTPASLLQLNLKNTIFYHASSEDMPQYLSIADICIAPFDNKAFPYFDKYGFFWCPIKLYEFMSMGKPTVSFDYPEIRKIVQDSGLLAPVGDIDSFVSNITYLIDNEPERTRLADIARKVAVAEYDWSVRAKQTVEIYKNYI